MENSDNELKMEKTKNRYAFVVAIALVLLLIITGAFAWLRIGTRGSETNTIKAGYLDLVLDESTTNGIRLEREIPKSYRQGILNTAYTFKLLNNSTIDTDYTISIVDDYTGADANLSATDKITDDLIRYVLVKNGEGLTASNSKILENNRAIDTGTIAGKSGNIPTETSYTLYVWIDSRAGDNATQGDIMSKIFNARLGITAEQHHQTSNENNNNENNGNSEEPIAPVQTAWQPLYFAFGTPTTSDTNRPSGKNIYAGMDANGNKGVCINKGGTEYCFQAGVSTIESEYSHLQQAFDGVPCDIGTDYISCHTTDLNCDFDSYGNLRCDDYVSVEHCSVNNDGSIECM